MKPPIYSSPPMGSKAQQYLHLARMFRDAARGMPAYVGPEQNWPAYFLKLHACELALKAFCDQFVANRTPTPRPPNHDLQRWYRAALQCGLPDLHVEDGIRVLAELHKFNYTRYPDNRGTLAPDMSIVADEVVERLIDGISLKMPK